jgi:hypothetical protein
LLLASSAAAHEAATGWASPDGRRLCTGHVTGAPGPKGEPGAHIVWERWASREATAAVAGRYAATHGPASEAADGCRIWRWPAERPTAVLAVCPPTARMPASDCPEPPDGTATLVTISTMSRPNETAPTSRKAAAPPGESEIVGSAVAEAIDRVLAATTSDEQQRAFDEILGLGCPAVPVLVEALADDRRLPLRSLRLESRAPDGFESDRRYAPESLGDAFAAILGHLTGRQFGFVSNGSTPELRRRTAEDWRRFLRETPPAELCAD